MKLTGLRQIMLVAALFLATFWGISFPAPARAGLKVLVSLPPQKHFAAKLGGGLVSITVMVPSGADAHTYEPKPRQMAALARADVYFTIGVEFERAWLARFKAANPNLKVVRTDAGLEKMPMTRPEEQGHGKDHGDEDGLDPHVWLSPRPALRLAANMAAGLAQADPANKSVYQTNLKALNREIKNLDRDLTAALAQEGGRRRILVFHPAWGYFCRDYGLKMTAVETEGREPTARELARLINLARTQGAKVIFVQPQFSDRAAQTLARAIGGKVVAIDPLAGDWSANLRRIAKEINQGSY